MKAKAEDQAEVMLVRCRPEAMFSRAMDSVEVEGDEGGGGCC